MLMSVFNQPNHRGETLIAVLEVSTEYLTTLSTMIIPLVTPELSERKVLQSSWTNDLSTGR